MSQYRNNSRLSRTFSLKNFMLKIEGMNYLWDSKTVTLRGDYGTLF